MSPLRLLEESGRTKARQKDKALAQKDTDLKIADRRVKIMEHRENVAKETLGDAKLSDAEKAARMRELFGVA